MYMYEYVCKVHIYRIFTYVQGLFNMKANFESMQKLKNTCKVLRYYDQDILVQNSKNADYLSKYRRNFESLKL